jgi:hypothetical protein
VCIAIITHPPGEPSVMTKLLPSRQAVLAGVRDNVFNNVKRDHCRLFWTAPADDENRAWHFERADGSFPRAGRLLFWYGVQDVAHVERGVREFEAKRRVPRSYLRRPVRAAAPRGRRRRHARILNARSPPRDWLQFRLRDARGGACAAGDDADAEESRADQRARLHRAGAHLALLGAPHPQPHARVLAVAREVLSRRVNEGARHVRGTSAPRTCS